MSIIDFNSGTWSNPWFRKLECDASLLFLYLKTNNHMLLAGLYPLDIGTMSFDTKLPADIIEDILRMGKLQPEIEYDLETSVVWVVNHVKEQFLKKRDEVAPTILVALKKALRAIPYEHEYVYAFCQKYCFLGIDYQDIVSGYSAGKGKGKGKDTGKGKEEESHAFESKAAESPSECIMPNWDEIGAGRK